MSELEQEITFEAAFDQLERIVDELQAGDLDLSASLASYERGVSLLARCQSLLDGVDRSVALLTGVNIDGSPITAAFDASATIAPEPVKPAAKASRSRKVTPVEPTPMVYDDIDPPF